MKDQIVPIAIRLLREGGYDSLNFSVIANELSTTRANLHHHFKNKEGLAEAALLAYLEVEATRLDDILNEFDGNLPSILAALEDHLIELAKMKRMHSACVGSQLLRDTATPPKLKEIAANRFRVEATLIRDQVDKFLRSNPDATALSSEALTFNILSLIHGIDMMGLIESDPRKLERDIKGSLIALIS